MIVFTKLPRAYPGFILNIITETVLLGHFHRQSMLNDKRCDTFHGTRATVTIEICRILI